MADAGEAERAETDRDADTAVVAQALTEQELRVLEFLAAGWTYPAAANRLNMSDRTLRRRITVACHKLGVSTRIEAMVEAARQGLI